MEQREFLNIIRAYRRRLDLAAFLKRLVFALGIGGGAGILLQTAALFVPMYYANVYTAVAILLAAASAVLVSLCRPGTMEQTALTMDAFGFKERIITAYENRREEGPLFVLQRADAMEQLKNHRDRIRIPLWPVWKKTALSAVLLAAAVALALIPSPAKDRTRELHRIRGEAGEKEEEIEEVLKQLEQLEEETLTPQQKAALEEMAESLRSSMAEYGQADSAQALQAAGDKLNYKYADMSSRMSDLAQSLRDGASASAMSAEAMQAMAEKMQEMSGRPSSGDRLASGQNGQSQSQGQGQGQNGQGQGQGQNGQSQSQGQGQGQNGQGQGQGQNGQGQGQNGHGQGQGAQGQGQSQSGQGQGAGRGTGTADLPHDYVSIPNAVADSGNLTGNVGDHSDSDYFRGQNGLSWEGTHMSHEAVIGNYERNAYEGIAAGRYPSGMESVIKDYFSSFN